MAIPTKIAVQVARLTMGDVPLIPTEKVEKLLAVLADRLTAARADKDSGEGALYYSWHGGRFRAIRSRGDDLL